METMIHTVIDLNNRGVQYLEAGDHELARVSFKDALERTTYLLNLKQEAEERAGFLQQSSSRIPTITNGPSHYQQQQHPEPHRRHQQQQQQQQQPEHYSQPPPSPLHSQQQLQPQRSFASSLHHHHHQQQQQQYPPTPQQQQQHSHHYRQQQQLQERRSSRVLQQHHNAIQRVPISTTLTSRCENTGSFIYSHALLLSRECCTTMAADEYCHRESSVIMFNLALVHHWRGMHFGVTSLLPKALKLYEMSYSLIQNGATFETHHLVLALLNNMGQIHHELTQYAQAEHCFKNLKDLLASGATQVLDGPEVQGFLMNIMFLEAPSMAPAA